MEARNPISSDVPPPVSAQEARAVWLQIAIHSFGGPAGQIAVMHRLLVDEKRWISEERFLHALNFCMLLPGPEAQQLATYSGWLLRGTRGGLLAGSLFILPGFLSIMALSVLYLHAVQQPWVTGLLLGLKVAVLAIVVQAVIRIGRRVLTNPFLVTVAVLSFVAIFFVALPFPLVIGSAAALGMARSLLGPTGASASIANSAADPHLSPRALPSLRRSFTVFILGLSLWMTPIAVAWWVLGPESVLVHEGLFFSKAAVLTFGGAYSVLSYVAEAAVNQHQWLAPGEMMDGLGMAESTPGPLIQVVQFVGFMGAHRHPGTLNPLLSAVLGSVMTTWVTFVPCFLWIFLGAPYLEALRGRPRLTVAMQTITAAVVGAVLNLAVWFALHVWFSEVHWYDVGFLRLFSVDLAQLHIPAVLLTLTTLVLTLRYRIGMLPLILGSSLAGALLA